MTDLIRLPRPIALAHANAELRLGGPLAASVPLDERFRSAFLIGTEPLSDGDLRSGTLEGRWDATAAVLERWLSPLATQPVTLVVEDEMYRRGYPTPRRPVIEVGDRVITATRLGKAPLGVALSTGSSMYPLVAFLVHDPGGVLDFSAPGSWGAADVQRAASMVCSVFVSAQDATGIVALVDDWIMSGLSVDGPDR